MSYSYSLPFKNTLPAGHELVGYTISQTLSRDEFSITYQATDTEQKNSVIIKEYLPASLAERDKASNNIIAKNHCEQDYEWGLAEYLNEANELINLNHPNIVNIRMCIEAHNTVYIISDYVDGISLESYAKSYKKDDTKSDTEHHEKDKIFPETEIISLLIPILDGLQVIHDNGYLHSDLTPFNILIEKNTHIPIIINLGDVKHIFRDRNREIAQITSAGYSAYEQYHAESKQGAWTDIYALGGILYRLISGNTPNSSMSRLASTVDDNGIDPLTPASTLGKDNYSEQLLASIDHAMKLQKTDRPQSVQAWRKELGAQEAICIEGTLNSEKNNLLEPTNNEQIISIDFSEINKPLSGNKKRNKAIVTAVIAIGALFAGVASYLHDEPSDKPVFDSHLVSKISPPPVEKHPIKNLKKQEFDDHLLPQVRKLPLEIFLTDLSILETKSKKLINNTPTNLVAKKKEPTVNKPEALEKKRTSNTRVLLTKNSNKSKEKRKTKKKPKQLGAASEKLLKQLLTYPGKSKEQYQREWALKKKQAESRKKWLSKQQFLVKERRRKWLEKKKLAEKNKKIEDSLIGADEW